MLDSLDIVSLLDQEFRNKLKKESYPELDNYLSNLSNHDVYTRVELIKVKCYLKELNSANQLVDELLESIDRISEPLEFLYALHAYGWVRYFEGKYNEAYKRLSQETAALYMITPSQSVDRVMIAVDYLVILGSLARIVGEPEEATRIFERGLHLAGAISDIFRIQELFGQMGKLQLKQGDYVQAIDRFRTAYEIAKEHNILRHQYMWLNGLAKVYISQGRLDEAEEFQREALETATQLEDKSGLVIVNFNLGDINFRRGKLHQALQYYTKFDFDYIKNYDTYALLLYRTFLVYHHLDDTDNTLKYLSLLEAVNARTNEKRITLIAELSRAIYLKELPTFKDKAHAETMLRKIIIDRNKPIDLRLNMEAFFYLAELLLYQLNMSQQSSRNMKEQEQSLWQELFELAHTFLGVAKKHDSHIFEIEANILLGHLSVARLEITKGKEYFERAHLLIDEHGINHTHFEQPKTDDDGVINPNVPDQEVLSYNLQDSINKIIHSLPRLNIIMYLHSSGTSTFKELQQALNFSSGNLTRHCDKLIEAGYVFKNKEFIDAKQTTTFQLTPHGYTEFENYSRIIKANL